MEIFETYGGFDNDNIRDYFVVDRERTTRKNGFKIIGKSFRSEESKLFYFSRIVNVRNSLPAKVVSSHTIETFKTKLDIY